MAKRDKDKVKISNLEVEKELELEEGELMEIDDNESHSSDSTTTTTNLTEDDESDKSSDNSDNNMSKMTTTTDLKDFKKNMIDAILKNEREWNNDMKKFDENAFHKDWEEKSGVKSDNEYFDVKDLMAQNPFPKLERIPTDYTFMFQNLAKMEADMKQPFVEDEHVHEFSDYNIKDKIKIMNSKFSSSIPKEKENQNDSETEIAHSPESVISHSSSPESPAINIDNENESSQTDNPANKNANNSEIPPAPPAASLNSPAPPAVFLNPALPIVAKKSAPPPPTSEVPMPRPAITAQTKQIRSSFSIPHPQISSGVANPNIPPRVIIINNQNSLPTTAALFQPTISITRCSSQPQPRPNSASTLLAMAQSKQVQIAQPQTGQSGQTQYIIVSRVPVGTNFGQFPQQQQLGHGHITRMRISLPSPQNVNNVSMARQRLIHHLSHPARPPPRFPQAQRIQSFLPFNNNNNNVRQAILNMLPPASSSSASNSSDSSAAPSNDHDDDDILDSPPPKIVKTVGSYKAPTPSPEKSQPLTKNSGIPGNISGSAPKNPGNSVLSSDDSRLSGNILICRDCRLEFPSTSDHLFRKHMLISHKIELTDKQIIFSVAKAKKTTGGSGVAGEPGNEKDLYFKCRKCLALFHEECPSHFKLCHPDTHSQMKIENSYNKMYFEKRLKYTSGERDSSSFTGEVLKCKICPDGSSSSSSFYTRTALRSHLKEHPLEDGKFIFDPDFRCALCLKKFDTPDALFEHVKGHKNGNRGTSDPSTLQELAGEFLFCDVCSRRHSNFMEAQSCLQTNGFIKCMLCSHMVGVKWILFHHMKIHGATPQHLLNCPFCDKCQNGKVRDVFEHIINIHYSKV